jgi:hypothetical protein
VRAILERMSALHLHTMKVAARSKSLAELRMRLIRDGTIRDEAVIEWYSRDGRRYRDVTFEASHPTYRE